MSLSIDGLSVSYGPQQILYDVGLKACPAGTVTGLIGPNAAGKSTLFRALTGLKRPDRGRLLLAGADLARMQRHERARCIAYMPQSFTSNAALSVFESVLLVLKQAGRWRVQKCDLARVEQTLAMLGLEPIAGRQLGVLSGGQAQMVSLAQCLVRDPQLMLLDEPTSALDLHHQLAIMTRVRNHTRERNIITLAALHDLNLAARFCDQLALIRDGRIVACGAPRDILDSASLGETYRVCTNLETTRRNTLFVDAHLGAQGAALH